MAVSTGKLLYSNAVHVGRAVRSLSFWWVVGCAWAVLEALAHRHAMNPDGISYLDMATTGELVNPVWSPLYPALVRAAFLAIHPGPSQEFPTVHLLNLVVFALAMGCFTFFLRTWRAADAARSGYAVPLGFGVFLWVAIELIGLGGVNPDMCVMAVSFLLAGLALRLARGGRWPLYAAFGAAMGLGFYAKAALLPLGAILLAILAIWPPSGQRRWGNILVAAAVWVAAIAPLTAALSQRTGHLSFGEAARLNYLWHVEGMEVYAGWTGKEALHPPRVLRENPRVLEFATPVNGTYPLWFDPAYWHEGARARLNVPALAKAVLINAEQYFFGLLRMGPLAAGLIALWFCGRGRRPSDPDFAWILLWSAAALALFLLVHVEIRYVAPFVALLWITGYDSLGRRVEEPVRVGVLCAALAALYISSITQLGIDVKSLVLSRTPSYLIVARGLRDAGVQPGAKLATIGDEGFEAYFARPIQARVVAEIPDPRAFWQMGLEDLAALEAQLLASGVNAVVVKGAPQGPAAGNWMPIPAPGGQYSVWLLAGSRSRSL